MYLTRFLGRETEVEHLAELFDAGQPRLVTLVGGGGHGKSRLAVETARRWPGGPAWFVPLADLWNGERLIETIGRGLDLTLTPMGDPLAQVAGFLEARTRPCSCWIIWNRSRLGRRARSPRCSTPRPT